MANQSGKGSGGDKKRGFGTQGGSRMGGRGITTRVKTARGRKSSSTLWLKRQLNDPYVKEAQRLGYRSRAAFKILEMNEKYDFLKPGARIVDLGAAPGGWTQVSVDKINALGTEKGKQGIIVGLDIQEMEEIQGATLITCDFLAPEAPELINQALKGKADIVLSDMAAPASGHTATDHLRIIGLLEVALDFARQVLVQDGMFIGKVLQGGTEDSLLKQLKRDYKSIKHVKPPSSRANSAEMYVIAQGFRGQANSE